MLNEEQIETILNTTYMSYEATKHIQEKNPVFEDRIKILKEILEKE